ncbi:ParB/RepB/Spo0J family partition protein [Alicyclobacillus mali]|uniref:ParB/RepB/Spo0J family partition protein n=1 Tax=Alicyclobacillus mali (ex Roth et al. 2021) TaxID=1123961 RepID=A0ABS0EZ76_9BACL|nr:ParB/RepB/Spo0J family partition protein [Alicyclobacillus mali (ex Roth et al. 2021)]MBF8376341.1 ParB/RepB/Spo0J family partition protein [Alicyclobacillus mali (ex Roth et al. 2021)]
MRVALSALQEHPENHLFRDLTDEELQALASDMQENGLIHPIVIRAIGDGRYEILSGHQRVRAARRLGWSDIEANVVEVDDNRAARMLISANIKTRTLSPMELAKAIRRERELIEELHGERRGRPRIENVGHDVPDLIGRWSKPVAEELGMSEKQVRRLDKLNELIPEFKELVDKDKLSSTAAEQLAYLDSSEQRALYRAFGDAIGEQRVAEIKALRAEIESLSKAKEEAEKARQQALMALENERMRLADLKRRTESADERLIAETRRRIADLETELSRLQTEKQALEVGIESLAERKAQEFLAQKQEEFEEKLKKISEKNRVLNEENQRLSEENERLAQRLVHFEHSELERARYRNHFEQQMAQALAEWEKVVVAARELWEGPLEGDPKFLHAIHFYVERMQTKLNELKRIGELRANGAEIVDATFVWKS